ncbi:hypothetical protein D3C85_1832150 [compost metagenome]
MSTVLRGTPISQNHQLPAALVEGLYAVLLRSCRPATMSAASAGLPAKGLPGTAYPSAMS